GSLIAKVNVANEHLAQSLLRTPEADRDLVRKRFIYGLVLSGVSFWKEFEDQEERDELVRKASSAIARILLPVVEVLGKLGLGL
ncbi:MAG: hypothetical protein JO053_10680, partial [Acidobacteria bacterium]|nr:hypothetical protein [Acidobacteriota bacterium]